VCVIIQYTCVFLFFCYKHSFKKYKNVLQVFEAAAPRERKKMKKEKTL